MSCPDPSTVYNKGHFKGSIELYCWLGMIQLLMSCGSSNTLIFLEIAGSEAVNQKTTIVTGCGRCLGKLRALRMYIYIYIYLYLCIEYMWQFP